MDNVKSKHKNNLEIPRINMKIIIKTDGILETENINEVQKQKNIKGIISEILSEYINELKFKYSEFV